MESSCRDPDVASFGLWSPSLRFLFVHEIVSAPWNRDGIHAVLPALVDGKRS